jgi:tripartite-type tricarboxylate transporter receptor subunit TctC
MVSAGPITINPSLYENVPFNPIKYLAAVALATPVYYVLVAHPSVAVGRMSELIELAKARLGKITFASAGVGSPGHLATEMLSMMADIKVLHVPYKGSWPAHTDKGSWPAHTDLLGGQVNLMFSDMTATIGPIRAGKINALAIGSQTRDPRMPELPTVIESGVRQFVAVNWIGLLAPAGTPRAIIYQLNAEVNRIIKLSEVQECFASDGQAFGENTPQDFAAFGRLSRQIICSQHLYWKRLTRLSAPGTIDSCASRFRAGNGRRPAFANDQRHNFRRRLQPAGMGRPAPGLLHQARRGGEPDLYARLGVPDGQPDRGQVRPSAHLDRQPDRLPGRPE